MRLLELFMSLPWWAYFLLAGGVGWFAYDGYAEEAAKAAEITAALEAPAPPVTDYNFGQTPGSDSAVPEVVLRAQIDTDRTTELVKRTNGIVTGRHIMYVLLPPDVGETPETLAGFIVVRASDKDALVEYFLDHTVGFGPVGPLVELPGWVNARHAKSTHVASALREQGFDRASSDFYLTPFINGRKAGLTAQATKATETTLFLVLAAFALALFGAAKRALVVFGRRASNQAPTLSEFEKATILNTAPEEGPGVYELLTPEEEAALTPLERIKRRQALGATARTAAPTAPVMPAAPPAAPAAPKARRFGFGRKSGPAPKPAPKGDGFDDGPIQSTRRSAAKRDPFARLAEEAARS